MSSPVLDLASVSFPGAVVPTEPLTSRQRDVLLFLWEFQHDHGFPPTVREIGERFNIHSPNGVMCHLNSLTKKGMIRRDPKRSRGIYLLREPRSLVCPCCLLPLVLGENSAGQTVLLLANPEPSTGSPRAESPVAQGGADVMQVGKN